MRAFSSRLKCPPNLRPSLQKCYDVSDIDQLFQGLLLSRTRISVDEGSVIIQICISCRTSLLDKKRDNPPKFAIANGLYTGWIPSGFEDSTFIENTMLNLSQPMHFISVVRGGKDASLRSHAYFFRADLPRKVISERVIGVTIVGAMTPAQKAATLKAYDIRVPRLRQQSEWYHDNNNLYANIRDSANWEAEVSTLRTRVVVDRLDDGSFLHSPIGDGYDELDRATWRHNAPTPAHQNVRAEDEVCEQAADGLISNFTHVDASLGFQLALTNNKTCIIVQRSTSILSEFDPAFWIHAFSELFPYGRGGLDETRPIKISRFEFVRYCLRLSTRRHAQHRSFALVAFDVLARHNAMQAIYIKARISPHTMELSASVPGNRCRGMFSINKIDFKQFPSSVIFQRHQRLIVESGSYILIFLRG
ncbi:hypothetical protein JG688_00013744 [Phytophthora aleatoria]|uniref:DUF6570 domain-containing protein n=1 Tax=Phytophthora aleatoria TaxID=2496075 RepID=A0A8J5J1C2_9STRA|nr:hypothetical protein JG688_00013744 [Phytophthora aleatoria]